MSNLCAFALGCFAGPLFIAFGLFLVHLVADETQRREVERRAVESRTVTQLLRSNRNEH